MRFLVFLPFFLGLGAVAGCAAPKPVTRAKPPDASTRALAACQKADAMWNDKIVPTRYGNLPPLTSPGILDLLTLARTSFTIRSLTNDSDELDEGHRKLVHAFGAEARFRLVPGKEVHGYSGIFQSGADCIIGRLSMATKPSATSAVPALALKIFLTGHQSVNLQVMNSTDGQKSGNFFEMPFSNIIPAPESFAKRMLQELFRKAAVAFGAKDPAPTHLTLEHLAEIRLDGTPVTAPRTPYRLIFLPTQAAKKSMAGATAQTDFRSDLSRFPVGQAMYDVYAFDEGEPFAAPAAGKFIGQLVTASVIVASSYGDEKLNFQHNMKR
jgi:hypothetical protein